MKRRAFIAAGAGLIASGYAGAAKAEMLLVNSPRDGFLNLRTGPGTRYNIIQRMAHGSEVETIEWVGNWVRVHHESGRTGWCSVRFLTHPADTSRWLYVDSPEDGYLNLREGPGTGYAIRQTMYNGELVEVLGRSGKWLKVRHEAGAVGWAFGRYLVE